MALVAVFIGGVVVGLAIPILWDGVRRWRQWSRLDSDTRLVRFRQLLDPAPLPPSLDPDDRR